MGESIIVSLGMLFLVGLILYRQEMLTPYTVWQACNGNGCVTQQKSEDEYWHWLVDCD